MLIQGTAKPAPCLADISRGAPSAVIKTSPGGLSRASRESLNLSYRSVSGASGVNSPGWVRNKRVDCPFTSGSWICSICIRSGFDLRYHFCPIGKAGDPL